MGDELKIAVNAGVEFAEALKPVKEFYEKNPMAKVAVDTIAKPVLVKVLAGDFEGAQIAYDEANKAGSMKLARELIRAEREDSSDTEQFVKNALGIAALVLKGALAGMV
jgi:hypothetical protein